MKKTKTVLRCSRCEYKWTQRSVKIPKECPACKSRYWEKPIIERREQANG